MIVNQFMKLLIVKQILLVICHGKCQENSVENMNANARVYLSSTHKTIVSF